MNAKLLFTFLFISTSLLAQDIEKIDNLYKKNKLEEAIEQGLKGYKINPYHPQLNMIIGRAYTDLGQYETAIPYLEKGAITEYNVRWVEGWSKLYLAKCYYILNNYSKSLDYLNFCINLNATENLTKEAIKYLRDLQFSDYYKDWEIIETEHFIFHFQTPNTIENKEEFIGYREAAYTKINEFFNAKQAKKIDFYVWSNPQQALEIFGTPLGFARFDLWIINSRANQTKGHEIAHILSGNGIKPNQYSKFINEGIAVYFDQSGRDLFKTAKDATSGKEVNIADLWENPKNYSEDLIYPIAGAFISFLFEKGSEVQIRSLMKDQSLKSAKKIYKNFDALMKEFVDRLKN